MDSFSVNKDLRCVVLNAIKLRVPAFDPENYTGREYGVVLFELWKTPVTLKLTDGTLIKVFATTDNTSIIVSCNDEYYSVCEFALCCKLSTVVSTNFSYCTTPAHQPMSWRKGYSIHVFHASHWFFVRDLPKTAENWLVYKNLLLKENIEFCGVNIQFYLNAKGQLTTKAKRFTKLITEPICLKPFCFRILGQTLNSTCGLCADQYGKRGKKFISDGAVLE